MAKNVIKKHTTKYKDQEELCVRLQQLLQIGAGKGDVESYRFTPFPVSILDDRVVLIKKFLDAKLCRDLIQLFSDLNVLKSFKQEGTKDYAARYNDRSSFTNKDIALHLWKRLRASLKQDTSVYENLLFCDAKGLNPQLRIYRYEKGHYFGKHYDDSVAVKGMGTTRWTLLIYLSGDEEVVGGDTVFYQPQAKKQKSVHPSKGLALLHEHGDNCLLHKASMVQRGVKWVLRSDVVF